MTNPTLKDVALRAGVSISAVSMYLNDRPGISQATMGRIASAIDEIGYVPRGSRQKDDRHRFLGLLVERLPLSLRGDHFYADVTAGMQVEVERLGFSLAISVLNQPQPSLPRMITEKHVAGVLAVGGGDITDAMLDQLADEGMLIVTVDNHSLTRHLNSVVVDNYRGAYLATRHLIDLGHQRIAIIRGPEKYKPLTERYFGYTQAMIEAGLFPEQQLVQASLSKGMPRKGYREMQQLLTLDPPPTAVFVVTDRTALGAMDALKEQGLRVPEDISIASFDNIAPDVYSHPALTTVTTARFEMGRIAVQRLHALINDPSLTPIKIVMPTTLVVRETTIALS